MIEQPPTPMRFVFSFSSKSEGEPPDVLVEDDLMRGACQWGQAAANHRARVAGTGVES